MGQLPSDQVKSAGFPTPEFFFWLSGGSASSNEIFTIAPELRLRCGHQTRPTYLASFGFAAGRRFTSIPFCCTHSASAMSHQHLSLQIWITIRSIGTSVLAGLDVLRLMSVASGLACHRRQAADQQGAMLCLLLGNL